MRTGNYAPGLGCERLMENTLSKKLSEAIQVAKRALRVSKPVKLFVGFAVTALFGFALLVVLKLGEPTSGKSLDADYATVLLAALSAENRRAIPVVFIDVDEQFYQSLNSPSYVPRSTLAELLAIAAAGKPAAIILDFDTSLDRADEVKPLEDYLKSTARDNTPLWLVRPFSTLPEGRDVAGAGVDRGHDILDPVVKSASAMRWVSAYLDTEKDWFLRRWRSYQAVCSKGASVAYPSVAVAASSLVKRHDEAPRDLDGWLRKTATNHCNPTKTAGEPATPPTWLRNANSTMTIPYGVGFTSELTRFGTTAIDGKLVPTFSRFSAKNLLDRKQRLITSDPLDLSGRVVIIGASYEASGDWHRTPLGRMPGMYILGNLVAFGSEALEENRWWGLKPFLLGLIILGLHTLSTIVFRGPVALMFTLVGAASFIIAAVRMGMAPATAYDGAVMGLALIALHATAEALIKSFSHGRRYPHIGFVAHYALSDDGRKWWSAYRRRRPNDPA